ncbi:potassium channel family protein [Desulfobacca acetoxidans]|uniref:TrkA-N domain protein n=1 Tax=Desulfobacca acetoxidans (strain ATCC 700848 / DSM 11109 / ASRB2) TaxID=880072 RepID=F2NCK9_DESAR|nr:TrkA family potassium uptake protein [Desulfobacca acetoxidans]AEB09143.1 TrkA-N domain protein [Desulfobacca acetoxidans DSM 11109]
MKWKKHICVIGLGQFGMELARELSKSCEVLALDVNEDLVYAIADDVQRAMAVDARDYASLKQVVTADFDEVIVSLGESLEASILCTLHLKKIGVKMIRAKVMSEDHAAILHSLGVQEVIFPERETAWRLAVQIMNPNLLDYIPLEAGYRVMDVAPPNSFYGRSLMELGLRKQYGVFVIAVKELVPQRFVFLPEPSFVVKPSDILVMIGREEQLALLQEKAA